MNKILLYIIIEVFIHDILLLLLFSEKHTTDIPKPSSENVTVASHDSQISVHSWLFKNGCSINDTSLDNQMLASQLTLYPWIYEVEAQQPTKSLLKKLKWRMGKCGRCILRPFQVLKKCVKGTGREN